MTIVLKPTRPRSPSIALRSGYRAFQSSLKQLGQGQYTLQPLGVFMVPPEHSALPKKTISPLHQEAFNETRDIAAYL